MMIITVSNEYKRCIFEKVEIKKCFLLTFPSMVINHSGGNRNLKIFKTQQQQQQNSVIYY